MPINQYARLARPLKGFVEADTASDLQGQVLAGLYKIEEYRENYPNADTDYAHIVVPSLGDEETWICTRWKDTNYAMIETKTTIVPDRLDLSGDEMAIDESHLTSLLPEFYDFDYDLDVARYPYPITGFKAPQAPPKSNNCCTFVEALVVKAWQNAREDFPWSQKQHGQMMIFSADDYFSPVTCLTDSEMALKVTDSDQAPHPWTVIQGWRKQWTSGHTFLILDYDPETDRVLTLESNGSYKLNGVGYRMIGKIKDFPKPPGDWRQNEQVWTWERMKSVYLFRKQAILKVKNRTFVS